MPNTKAKLKNSTALSPLEVLKRIIEDNPGVGKTVYRDRFVSEIIPKRLRSSFTEREYSLLVQCVVVFFNREVNRILDPTFRSKNRGKLSSARAKGRKALKLLLQVMSNGKPLGECTGAEGKILARDARIHSGYLTTVFNKVSPRQKAKSVWTEEGLVELLKEVSKE